MSHFFRINKLYLSVLIKRSKLFFFYRIMLIGLGVVSALATMYFPKFFFDAITEKKDFMIAMEILILYLIYTIINVSIVNVFQVHIDIINDDVRYDMKQIVMERAYKMPFDQFDDPECYDKIQRAVEFVESGSYQSIDSIAGILSDVLSLAAVFYVLSQLNLWVILFLAIAMATEFIVNLLRDKEVFSTKKRLTRLRRQMNYFFQIMVRRESLKDLRLNNAHRFISDKFDKNYKQSRKETIRLNSKILFLRVPTRITDAIFTGGLYGFLGWDLFKGVITMGSFTMLLSAATNVKSLILTIQAGISQLRQSTMEAHNFYDIFDEQNKGEDSSKLKPDNWDGRPVAIQFSHVTFTYPGQTHPVIEDLSFLIEEAQKAVFVGENGAGKSTIIKLMLGLYQPDSGHVFINGMDIQELDKEALYSIISVVFQDHSEFSFSIAENILMDYETADKESSVKQALDMAGLAPRIEGCPLKEKTPLTRELADDGIDLSGGERQKLAIARAYIKKSGLLIMDEPSSSLDVFSEEELFRHLRCLSRQQTTVLITHRVLALKGFDRILYVEKGRIAEDGTHEELFANQGLYYDMYRSQISISRQVTEK